MNSGLKYQVCFYNNISRHPSQYTHTLNPLFIHVNYISNLSLRLILRLVRLIGK
jgi:hypothetical protein